MRLLPVASDGWKFILPSALFGGALIGWGPWVPAVLGSFILLFSIFSLFFFRDFNRKTKIDESLIYSPGDGKVLGIETIEEGELKGWQLIRIFLSVFDGHIQRIPVSGKIESVDYKKGVFLDARHPRAHFENEQNKITISNSKGTIFVSQIAGLIARRIVCWVNEGAQVFQGERYGLIRFGSQVDVLIPPKTELKVRPGDRVKGGTTVLAQWLS